MIFPYLEDKEFLKYFDQLNHKEKFVRISVLDFKTEVLIADVEGLASGGSVNISGTSNMRRTMSCTIVVNDDGIKLQGYEEPVSYANITEVENLFSMNKKVKVAVGFYNTTSQYAEYDIIWFPLGMFVVKTASVAKSTNGINISLTMNDKTALLNGDMGGTIPAATVFSESELYNASGTNRTVEQVLIKDIIKSLVVEFGGEKPENVLITDIDDYARSSVRWLGDQDLYYYEANKTFTLEKLYQDEEGDLPITYKQGASIGYSVSPFVYPGTLECKAGESVAAMLDKIKNALGGNYEWFYDINGRFVFQQKKNYINESLALSVSELDSLGYLSQGNYSKSVYTFDNLNLITNISNSPQYQNIKNDFVVWGSKKGVTGIEKPIRYHLAFAQKPPVDLKKKRAAIVYTDYRKLKQADLLKEGENYICTDVINAITDKDKYYITSDGQIYHWDEDTKTFRNFSNEWKLCYLVTDCWQTELYYLGLEKSKETFFDNYYAAELNAEWPKIYDITKEENGVDNFHGIEIPVYKGGFKDDFDLENYEYFLDFIETPIGQDTSQNLSQFNVDNIGRRVKIDSESKVDCLFPPAYETGRIIISADGDTKSERAFAESMGIEWVQIYPHIYKHIGLSKGYVSAYDRIKELLVAHSNYNETIQLTTIPIYHLDVNTRITIEDQEIGINGDYIITTISLPLAPGTSNISCVKCLEKTI